MLKLHIGAKTNQEGWKTVNADPNTKPDYCCNAKKLSFLTDNSVDIIYASHILEHFCYMTETAIVLREWHRVLKPGGLLCVSVPDMDTLARLYVEEESPALKFHLMRLIFGGHLNKWDCHGVGFNEDLLRTYLNHDWTNITRVKGFGFFKDTSEMYYNDVLISLNMTAEKEELKW